MLQYLAEIMAYLAKNGGIILYNIQVLAFFFFLSYLVTADHTNFYQTYSILMEHKIAVWIKTFLKDNPIILYVFTVALFEYFIFYSLTFYETQNERALTYHYFFEKNKVFYILFFSLLSIVLIYILLVIWKVNQNTSFWFYQIGLQFWVLLCFLVLLQYFEFMNLNLPKLTVNISFCKCSYNFPVCSWNSVYLSGFVDGSINPIREFLSEPKHMLYYLTTEDVASVVSRSKELKDLFQFQCDLFNSLLEKKKVLLEAKSHHNLQVYLENIESYEKGIRILNTYTSCILQDYDLITLNKKILEWRREINLSETQGVYTIKLICHMHRIFCLKSIIHLHHVRVPSEKILPSVKASAEIYDQYPNLHEVYALDFSPILFC